MILQSKNKYLLFVLLLFLSSCSTTINQEIFEDGKTTISINTIIDSAIDYCSSFERQLLLFDQTCTQNQEELFIEGSYYLDSEILLVEKGLFITKYTYDLENLYSVINSFIGLESPGKIISKDDSFDTTLTLALPGSIQEHFFEEEENTLILSKNTLDSSRSKIISSKVYHILPIIFMIFFFIFILLVLLFFLKYKNKLITSNEVLSTISPEEQKCKKYILQFKNQYPKEVLYQGLVNSGVSSDKAQNYVIKYY